MKRWLPRPRPVMRTLLVVLLLLVAGAIVNVAVTWGLASIVEVSPDRAEWVLDSNDGGSWVLFVVHPAGSRFVCAMVSLNSSDAREVHDDRIPAWSRFHYLPAYVKGEPMPMLADCGFGWPCIDAWYSVDSLRDWKTGTVMSRKTAGVLGSTGLPLRPLWPGFAINTLFYAVVLWGLFAAPFALRRRRRIKRGLCPKCAYPIGTSAVCTECGKPVAKHKAQTQKAEMS